MRITDPRTKRFGRFTKFVKIYIASSWKNQHAVELLTALLREARHEVKSFVEHEGKAGLWGKVSFDEWVNSEDGADCFAYDTSGATDAELVVYVSPSGVDAWAEVGAAWSRGVAVVGLLAKGEQVGLMRRMVANWCSNYRELLDWVERYAAMRTAAGLPAEPEPVVTTST